MSILSIVTDEAGQIEQHPRRVKIVTTDDSGTVTLAGYLNTNTLLGYTLQPTDVIDMIYSYNTTLHSGTYAIFIPTWSHSVITLTEWVNPGNVTGPVVSGDFAVFDGTEGAITDSGFSPTDATKAKVVMLNAAPTSGHIASFSNVNGTIGDGGVLGTAAAKAASDNTKSTLASVTAATTSGNLAKFNDTTGTVGDSAILASSVQLNTTFVVADDTNMVSNSTYMANGFIGEVTLTLPLTSAAGDMLTVLGLQNGNGWIIAQNANQSIILYSSNTSEFSQTTVGVDGSLASASHNDNVTLICTVSNIEWTALGTPPGDIVIT